MSRLFYFVRHGQTYFNLRLQLQGRCDSPLTPLGIQQAEKSAKVLSGQFFDCAFASPAGRVRETADILLKNRQVKLTYLEDLQEPNFGIMEGRQVEDQDLMQKCFGSLDFEQAGGEGKEELRLRTEKVFQEILSQTKKNDRILIVSHGIMSMAFMSYILKLDMLAYRQACLDEGRVFMPNAGILIFQEDHGKVSLIQKPCEAKDLCLPKKDKTIDIFYVRHGQTLFNLRHQVQGRSDAPLTDLGIEQAIQAQQALKNKQFSKAYVSYAKRAVDTAKIVLAGHDTEISIEKNLQEMNFGDLEGRLVDEAILKELYACHQNQENFLNHQGENLGAVKTRWQSILEKVYFENQDGDQVLFVGHGTMYAIMVAYLLKTDRLGLEAYCKQRGQQYSYNGGIARFQLNKDGIHLVQLMQDPKTYLHE
ncbi:histidine phosphatase family protein [Bulleidia sp. zg-1006]|uniref:histidine phosphatase family protein n=1 Tax=Bulleidia sp. zg-1006 TaxID=2806552 RepID=UPI00193A3624|nr:histidine phosphatase family protein [Bulleidia sp. zg-1006]QRG87088.1 histidine phosphatase family protein [Bulleidia sp. zg-1006]